MTTEVRADLYPSRGAAEMTTPRQDPVIWSAPGAPGPIAAKDLQGYEHDGFLTVDQLITPDEVAVYEAELNRLVSDPAVRADER
ncbi:ectoine hydroxylase, partial [Streptomyces sp. SID8455]|nr:ectoine hydroxylase [Streptomyces sp. SID8455]